MKRIIPFFVAACLCFAGCSDFSSYENDSVTDISSAAQSSTETLSEYTVSNSEFESSIESDVSTTETTQNTTAESTILKTDDTIQVPAASYMCEGKHYSEVLEIFENAGFTNVTAYPFEEDYNKDNSFEGCVIMVFADGDSYFDDAASYPPDTKIDISYVISPAETKVSTTTTWQTISAAIDDHNGVTVPKYSESEGDLVWVPTNGGTKYHSRAGCSNMKDPIQVTKDTAIANGYTPCGRCY